MKNFYKPEENDSDDSLIFETVNDENVIEGREFMAGNASDEEADVVVLSNSDDDDDDEVSLQMFGYDGSESDSDSDDDSSNEDDDDIHEADNSSANLLISATDSGTRNGNDDIEPMDEDPEDEVVRKIVAETKKERDHPPDIKTDDFVFDLCFHPTESLLSVGTITGDVILYKYTNDSTEIVQTLEVHTKAIRDVNFSDDGKILYSVSKDKCIMLSDVVTGQLKNFYEGAHENPIYSLCIVNENVFATGDDDGVLKVWDLRQKQHTPMFRLRLIDDYISQILTNDDGRLLVVSSGDGYLTSVNIGSKSVVIQSEPYEEGLNCMGLFRNDSKLVVGSSKGNLYSYNWGEFGIHSDKFPGPKTGINCMVPITNRIAVVGGEEGILRAMHVVPGRNLGIVGQHSLGVEAIDINNSGEFIASCSHDNDIRFWNIGYFEDFDDIKYNKKSNESQAKRHNLPSSKNVNASAFFSDLVGGGDE